MARILVLDDEILVQMVLCQMLQDAGHSVIEGGQGEAMRRDLRDRAYDLVVTDLNMPDMTGWDVARWIREHRPRVPVFAMSGRLLEEVDPVWTNAFYAFFSKPVDEPKLISTIARVTAG